MGAKFIKCLKKLSFILMGQQKLNVFDNSSGTKPCPAGHGFPITPVDRSMRFNLLATDFFLNFSTLCI